MIPTDQDWSRRELLKAAAAASLTGAGNFPAVRATRVTPADPERIRRENALLARETG